MRSGNWFGLVILIGSVALADVAESPLQKAQIGDLRLVSGEVLLDCEVGYRTAGKLNADRSNVIVFPSWYGGSAADLLNFGIVGPGGIADTDRYYVILVDALGNGISSSPSTSARQPGKAFPAIAIDDMVNAAHTLLTRQLGFEHVHAVMGISMGGMQTLQWIAQYPGFMDKAVAIDGSPKLTSYDLLLWHTHVDTIELLQQAGVDESRIMRLNAQLSQLNLWTPEYFVANVPPDELHGFIARNTTGAEQKHPDDVLAQLQAMIAHDVYADFNDAERGYEDRIQAEVMIAGGPSDHMVNAAPAKALAATLGARYAEILSDCGHIGTACEMQRVAAMVSEFLE
ncbi:MAG TPA: alpha/beta fold hydrolase [Woeseiaceae bacterium]